ncbi:MAG: HAD family hydrolase [Gemmatimonadota bacterium]
MRDGLLFDFGGTLDADGVPWADRFFAVYRRAGGRLDRTAFTAAFRASDERLAETPGIRQCGFAAMIERQAAILQDLLPDGYLVPQHGMAERFVTDARLMAARNRPVLAALAARHRLGIVSNFTGNLVPCLVELGFIEFFDVVQDSAVVGVAKPAPAIFLGALAALDLPASRCWMVGDNPSADLAPAQALGLRTCWLAPAGRPAGDCRPTARIAHLTDLPEALQWAPLD